MKTEPKFKVGDLVVEIVYVPGYNPDHGIVLSHDEYITNFFEGSFWKGEWVALVLNSRTGRAEWTYERDWRLANVNKGSM